MFIFYIIGSFMFRPRLAIFFFMSFFYFYKKEQIKGCTFSDVDFIFSAINSDLAALRLFFYFIGLIFLLLM